MQLSFIFIHSFLRMLPKAALLNYALFLACFLLISSCRKEKETPEQLPPVTSHGANTFGMIVNGKISTARGADKFSGGMFAQFKTDSSGNIWYPPDSSDIYLRILNSNFPISYLFVTDPRVTTEWRLNKSTQTYMSNLVGARPYMEVNHRRSSLTTDGYFRSEFRHRNDWVFSGEFSFHCVNPKTCQEFKVTDGRIDVNLRDVKPY